MYKYFLLSCLFFACDPLTKPSLEEYKKIGYKEISCNKIDFIDLKSDLNPYYKIYSSAEIVDDNRVGLLVRCFDSYNCTYEIINNSEIICQKLTIIENNSSLYKEWEEHTVLINNLKIVN